MPNYDRVVIVGVGLLGGSIGLALRQRKLAKQVIGFSRTMASLDLAIQRGAIDRSSDDLPAACAEADIIVICTPVQQVVDFAKECLSVCHADCLVTDVGSTKLSICQEIGSFGADRFCGSHPLAGSDKSGVQYSSASLFEDKLTVLTPMAETAESLTKSAEVFWQQLGSRTVRMTPQRHDEAIALTSHLPHVVASALAATTPPELLPLAASGWSDTTRVAAGNIEMWMQILEENRGPVLAALRQYAAALEHWIKALSSNDRTQLESLLTTGKSRRDSVGN